jgi:hypothetical protein
LVISQAYEAGQYALDSASMSSTYWEKITASGGGEEDDE